MEERSSAGLGLHLQAKPSLLSDLLKTLLEVGGSSRGDSLGRIA